jgi:electron transport complex protein RnfB
VASLAAIPLALVRKTYASGYVWQIDPFKCTQCGQCKTNCVKTPSAVKCTHAYVMCGYCDLCGGYLRQGVKTISTGAENQLCPTGAIERKFVEEPYFEYTMYLQIHQDLCDNCNDCSIARNCPSQAISRVQAGRQYIPKDKG